MGVAKGVSARHRRAVKTFAERLRWAMAEAGYSGRGAQERFATASGLHKTTISQYLTGKREPEKGSLGVLAQALGCNRDWLDRGVGDVHVSDRTAIQNENLRLAVEFAARSHVP